MRSPLLVALTAVGVVAWSRATADAGHIIRVHASTFRSPTGPLRCRLYSRPDGFAGKPPYEAEQAVAVTSKTAACAFGKVANGTYAIALFHDENNDGKLDTNFLGIPPEGVGVANNKVRSLGPPKWDDAKFNVKGNVDLDITLLY
jgi:uncharacterized protein (DUF2141 family)